MRLSLQYFQKHRHVIWLIFSIFLIASFYISIKNVAPFSHQFNWPGHRVHSENHTTNTVHIVLSVKGEKYIVRGVHMIKSMLYYANRFNDKLDNCAKLVEPTTSELCPLSIEPAEIFPIHVHIICDPENCMLAKSEMSKWNLQSFQWTIYSGEPHMKTVGWIPNDHRAGPYALMKLILPDILPVEVEKVIFLDSDTMLNYNIMDLWEHFRKFSDTHLFGMAWEQDVEEWRCLKQKRFYGVNSGVILLDLDRLRKSNWTLMWKEELSRFLAVRSALSEGEQNIYRTLIQRYPTVHYRLPCEWNVQLYGPASLMCCPVVWPTRRPNEQDCLSHNFTPGTPEQKNLLKLAHYDDSPKPESADLRHEAYARNASIMPDLTHKSMKKKFLQVYYQFEDVPHRCFQ